MTDESERRLPERVLVARYQACAQRLWAMFPRDPLPSNHPAQAWVERLEALLNHGMLGPVRLCVIQVCPHCKRVDSLFNNTGDRAWCKTCSKEVKPEVMS